MTTVRRPAGGSEKVAKTDIPAVLSEAVAAVEDHKGEELLVLDLRGIASFTDFLLLCTGRSERHVQAIADGIAERLREESVKALHTEGYDQANWVLIDYVDFLVNVFTPETREYYQLERVWRDAPIMAGGGGDGSAVDGGLDGAADGGSGAA
ncbi:MAG: ribosome silencing factor [Acidobacteriota bacterium]